MNENPCFKSKLILPNVNIPPEEKIFFLNINPIPNITLLMAANTTQHNTNKNLSRLQSQIYYIVHFTTKLPLTESKKNAQNPVLHLK